MRIISGVNNVEDLENKGIVSAYPGRTRKVEYAINYVKADDFIKHFRDICVKSGERGQYLTAVYDGTEVRERISSLDYEQYESGSLSSSDLVHKYMAYLSAM